MNLRYLSCLVLPAALSLTLLGCGSSVPAGGETGPNTAPVITTEAGQSVIEGRTLVVNLQASDAEEDSVVFQITGGNDWDRFSVNGSQLNFKQAPDYETPADANGDNVYQVAVTANDGKDFSDALNLNVTVLNTNEPVVQISAPEDYKRYIINEPVSFSASASDIEDDANNIPLQYIWDFGVNSGVGTSSVLNPEVAFPNNGDYTVEFAATDSDGNRSSVQTHVRIEYPPIIDESFNAANVNAGSNGESSGYSTYRIAGIAVDNNNRPIMASSRICDNTCFTSYLLLRRYGSDGVLDTAYGPSSGHVLSTETLSASANAIAVDQSNRLLVTGNRAGNMVLWRYDTSGLPDNTMNSTAGSHFRVHPATSTAYFVMVDSQGRYVVTGSIGASGSEKMAVWRFLSTGAPDTNFATAGVYTDDSIAPTSVGRAVTETSGGDLLITGNGQFDSQDLLVWKLSGAGVRDTNFGNGTQFNSQTVTGLYRYDASGGADQGKSISTDSNGNIYVAGIAGNGNNDAVLVKMSASGAAQNFAANAAYVYTETATSQELFNSVRIVNDKIRLLGVRQWGTFSDAIIMQLNLDGSPDPAFKNGGIIRQSNSYYFYTVSYLSMDLMQMDSQGRMLIQTGFDRGFRVWRYRF